MLHEHVLQHFFFMYKNWWEVRKQQKKRRERASQHKLNNLPVSPWVTLHKYQSPQGMNQLSWVSGSKCSCLLLHNVTWKQKLPELVVWPDGVHLKVHASMHLYLQLYTTCGGRVTPQRGSGPRNQWRTWTCSGVSWPRWRPEACWDGSPRAAGRAWSGGRSAWSTSRTWGSWSASRPCACGSGASARPTGRTSCSSRARCTGRDAHLRGQEGRCNQRRWHWLYVSLCKVNLLTLCQRSAGSCLHALQRILAQYLVYYYKNTTCWHKQRDDVFHDY